MAELWRSANSLILPPEGVNHVRELESGTVAERGVRGDCDECNDENPWLWRWLFGDGRTSKWVCFYDLDAVGGFEEVDRG